MDYANETSKYIEVYLRAGEFCGVHLYNKLNEATEFKFELITNSTTYVSEPSENATMSWVYDWEFDLRSYTIDTSRNERITLQKN